MTMYTVSEKENPCNMTILETYTSKRAYDCAGCLLGNDVLINYVFDPDAMECSIPVFMIKAFVCKIFEYTFVFIKIIIGIYNSYCSFFRERCMKD